MNIEKCFYLGQIQKTNGLKGGLLAFFDVDDITRYQNLESVFVDLKGKLIPFFIKSLDIKPDFKSAVIVFNEYEDFDKAKTLCGLKLYLPLELLPKLKGKQFYFHEVEGYEVLDEEKGSIGILETIIDLPNNPLFSIKYHDKEILIPLQDKFIVRLSRDTKQLFIKAPEGLIDLYL